MMAGDRLLVDLDSILDFRLSTMAILNDEYASTLIGNPKYIDRTRDDEFYLAGGISHTEYLMTYANRGIDFKHHVAKPTGIFMLLGKIISERLVRSEAPLSERKFYIEINVYPFRLSEEACRSIANAVAIYLDTQLYIETVSYSPTQLTPSLVRDTYSDVVLYDFNEWYVANHLTIPGIFMPEVRFHTPAIARGKRVSEMDQDILREVVDVTGSLNPFEVAMYELSDNLSLRYEDTRFFTIETASKPVGA